ncbi:Fluoride-specific ion channel FluC OS=Tsukamurella paurometabola (strain ATCC 8368 / DSM / CCUG 35730 / CIP 100753 / JCM 10117 / KCTC 9821 / NBRC 16120/ NCIMB 702349 / NCTC 13040) OX=521096 GN=fluC PE=3 SV=1 [Tsukamurella paurometabola]|uniref:Fluoride-specific ion channel FluC n=1 Tax=Tsukamurella paurometabola (strain ATCC 8368 / DSM 20162 / CCUG 35730 / CIP 100753 / JCM 10117 / KCTC 9821 / NBRC 16120 / NCIMB 702349 / NCTC 13040) TaxID=521096 RepID=D5UMQ9_TSUPD|nr:CrcB family protein [Tsukamurella paurometabola]ADG80533.1 CrcB protein [Tsukamurella paurometabola DSM 20162]SUP39999.1 camphor resistance protein CrcB [Tsukamurella paurometabola]
MTTALICLGGGLGAVLRFLADTALRSRFEVWSTALINATGSLLLGLFAGFAAHGGIDSTTLAVLGTGVCGGYTTFSTATVETLTLLRDKHYREGIGYGLGTLGLSLVAVWGGFALGAL